MSRPSVNAAVQFMSRNPPAPFIGAPFQVQVRRKQAGLPAMAQQRQLAPASFVTPTRIVVPEAAAAAAAPADKESVGYPMTQPDDEHVSIDLWDDEEEGELKAPEDKAPAAAAAAPVVIDLTADNEEEAEPPAKKRKGPTEGKSKLVYYEKVYVKQGKALIEAFIKKSAFVHPDVLWGEIVHSDVEDPDVVDDGSSLM